MMKLWGLVLLFAAVYAKHEGYANWKSYYVQPHTRDQLYALGQFMLDYDVEILSHPILAREGVVLVSPQNQLIFTKKMEELGVTYRIHVDDIKKQLDYDDENIEKRKQETMARNGGKQLPYDNYQEWEVIDAYLDDIARRYPNLVTLVTPANSYEGRPIKYLKISTTNFQDLSKPVIVIDGGIHAREWISPPTITWAIHKLVEDVTESDMLNDFDWVLLPVANPDGYKHTFSANGRFWRKTRSTDQHTWSQQCPGVDGNRNYDFHFNTVGTSSNPCSDTYPGSRAFSEVETRVVRDILQEHLPRIALYLTMHSYGSMILYPWGHDGSLSSHALALHTVGIDMVNAIQANALPHFPNYVVGNAVQVIGYPASGASEDYAHVIGVRLAYTYELPGLASGLNGFHLDPKYIAQVCHETWQGIVAGARRAKQIVQN